MSFVWECMWKTSAATLLVWMLACLLRRHSAAIRHILWISALTAFLVVPLLLPISQRAVAVRVPARLPQAIPAAFLPVPPQVAQTRTESDAPLPWKPVAAALWLAGVLAIVLRRTHSSLRVSAIVGRATSAPELQHDVLLSDEVQTPLTCGILRPVILLPTAALDWSPECFGSALLHEREHLRRRDCLSHWFAEVICAIWWFHPFAWLARNRAAHERECACDDAVLRGGVRPSDYASALLHLASTRSQEGEPAMALSALSNFERRIRNLLLPNLDRRPAGRRSALAVCLVTGAIMVPLALLHAQTPVGTGDLSGTVFDPSGARVPNAQIIASGSTGNREVTRADAAGEWTLSGIPAGTYTVETRSRGFVLSTTPATLEVGQRAKIDIRLKVGSVQETVDVVSQGQPRRPAIQPSATPERLRVGGNVQATKLLKRVNPKYPAAAKAQGIEGTVLMSAVIGKAGNLLSLTVVNKLADPDLAAAALEAVQQWRYEPTLLNGQPVEVVTTITVNFRLEN